MEALMTEPCLQDENNKNGIKVKSSGVSHSGVSSTGGVSHSGVL